MFFLASIYPIQMMLPPDREFRQPLPSLLLIPSMQNILVHFYKCNEDLVVAGSRYKILHGKRHLFSKFTRKLLYLLAVCLCVQHDCVYCARFHVSRSKSRELPTALRPWKGNIKRRTYRQCSPRNISRPSSSETNKGKGYKRENPVLSIVFAENRVLRLTFAQQQSWAYQTLSDPTRPS